MLRRRELIMGESGAVINVTCNVNAEGVSAFIEDTEIVGVGSGTKWKINVPDSDVGKSCYIGGWNSTPPDGYYPEAEIYIIENVEPKTYSVNLTFPPRPWAQITCTQNASEVWAYNEEYMDRIYATGSGKNWKISLPSHYGAWTFYATPSSSSYVATPKTVNITSATKYSVSITMSTATYYRVGGRIFYDDGDNGASYRFFNSNKVEITDTSISGLANAYYYTIAGTPTKDRWYVYDTTLAYNLQWGKRGDDINITSDGIGKGKTNTATALAQTGWENDSIFTWIQQQRTNKLGGCNDWFIASNAEQEQLWSSGLVDWYSSGSKVLWSSVESSPYYAYRWNYYYSRYTTEDKGVLNCAFAARAF